MAVVYVIQVMAYHAGGAKGWRTVRKPGGAAYGFDTQAAAQQALRRHFGNLQEGITVRIASMEADMAQQSLQVTPTEVMPESL